ncbi:MAG: hypothetical protein GXC76_14150 [Rhodanobacteraceae bacterium]|jgi:hypothetical protein|nr:hypothetical protein [Rhodanobacteraceae bacterium]
MSLTLLAPLGLAALAALGIPLLLHLVRRLELITTEFAALRWIAERARPRRRVRFERPWLLALRLALLALLALLLAQPVLTAPPAPAKPWAVVAPGVERGAARAAAPGLDADWRWLAPDFPPLDEAPPPSVPLASLLRELDAQLSAGATAVVVVPEELAGLDGERPHLARAFDWRVVPGRMAAPEAATPTPTRLVVRYAPDATDTLTYLRAAVAAWNVRAPGCCTLDAQPLDAPLPTDARWLVWLAPQVPAAITAWIERGGVALLTQQGDTASSEPLWRAADGRVLAARRPAGHGRIVALRGALAPADLPLLIEADFPARLHAAFEASPLPPTRAPAASTRRLQASMAAAAPTAASAAQTPLDPWLALAIALLFVLERVVATKPHAEATP